MWVFNYFKSPKKHLVGHNPGRVGQLVGHNPGHVGQLVGHNPGYVGQLVSHNPGRVGQLVGHNPGHVGQLVSHNPGWVGQLVGHNPGQVSPGPHNILPVGAKGLGIKKQKKQHISSSIHNYKTCMVAHLRLLYK
uniref:Uncharacterized protein n=1 Tax=Eptatretus burgeri TaxID=7764 RepID=A0A8C4RAP9_EPTBU